MAKVKRNPILEGLSGKFGDVVFRHTKNGKMIICHKPDFSNRQFSQDQLDHQDRVKLAAAYGKAASREHPIYAEKAKGTSKNAYNIAFKDWFHPPVLDGIRYHNGRLRVDVMDDVMVTRVWLTILDPEGNVLEQGDAELEYGAYWNYQPMNTGRILVEAWDLPGNMAQHEFCPPSGPPIFWEQSARTR